MISGLISGKVYGTPQRRTSKTGNTFAIAKVRKPTGEGGESLFTSVIAFDDEPCAALLALGDGDSVSLAGTLTPKVWIDKEGTPRPALDIVASHVLTAYHVQRKRRAVTGE